MKRLLATTVAAVAVLAGCGNDTCTSNPAKLDPTLTSPSCAVGAATSVSIQVPLCSRCNDSAPGCQAEVLGNRVELQPVVQQCQDQSGCASAGCSATARTATCTFNAPAAGNYQLVVVGDTQPTGTLVVQSGGATTCSL